MERCRGMAYKLENVICQLQFYARKRGLLCEKDSTTVDLSSLTQLKRGYIYVSHVVVKQSSIPSVLTEVCLFI